MIRQVALVVILVVAAVSMAAGVSTAAGEDKLEDGFVSMFNGKDLTGWEGKPGGWWVEDGAITSRSTKEKPCKKHHYLMWRGGKPGFARAPWWPAESRRYGRSALSRWISGIVVMGWRSRSRRSAARVVRCRVRRSR